MPTLPAGFIAPCLPSKADKLPCGSQWLHETARTPLIVLAARPIGKMKNADAPAVKREAEEDWGNGGWR